MGRAKRRGPRGQGTVYRDGAGWRAALSVGIDRTTGRRRTIRVRAPDRDSALDELERLRRAHVAGVDPRRGTLDDWLADWLAAHGPSVRDSTRQSYAHHVSAHISPLLGGIRLSQLRPSDVRRLMHDRLAMGLSPATVGRILTTLRVALGQAVRERVLVDNPADAVPLPRVERHPVEAMTEAHAQRITEAVRGTTIEALVALLLGSGLRLGEALGLDRRDVGDGFVVVRRSKTTARAVPISDDAQAALARHLAAHPRIGPDEPVFLGPRTADRLLASTAWHVFRDALERAGLAHMRLHDLRHGAATLMVARGVHMRVVAEQLGHRNPALTARTYAHVLPESQRAAARTLNRQKADTGT